MLGATTFFVSQTAPGGSDGSTEPTSYTQRPEYKVLGCTLGERSLNIISQGTRSHKLSSYGPIQQWFCGVKQWRELESSC